jgi:hypothetical protein
VGGRRWLLGIWLVLLSPVPMLLRAQSSGQAQVGIESYDDSLPGLSARGLYAETSLFLSSGGMLEGTFNFLLDDQNRFKLGRNALTLREFPWGDARFSASAGDLFEFLDRPGLRFSNDLTSRPLFRGISLLRDSAPLTVSLFGGRNEVLIGSGVPSIALAPEAFAGGSAAWRPLKGLTLDFSTLQTHNEKAGAASLSGLAIPDRAQTYGGGLTAALGTNLTLRGRLSYSQAEVPDGSGTISRNFLSYLVGGLYQTPHWHIESNYVRYGVDYVPLSTLFAGNREGPFLLATYSGTGFSASGSAQQYRNNPEGTPGILDLRTTSYQLSSTVQVGRQNSVGASYSDQQLRSRSPGDDSEFRQRTAGVQASIATYGSTLLRYQYQDLFSTEGARQIHELEVDHYMSLRPLSLFGVIRYQRDNRGATSTVYRGGLDATLGPARLFVSGEWGDDLSGGTIFTENRNRTISYGASIALPAELVLQADGYRNRTSSIVSAESVFVNPELSIASLNHSTLVVKLTRAFRWGKQDAPQAFVSPSDRFGLPYGSVEGTAFSDLNADGARDPGEAGVAGIVVRLDGGQLTRTGTDGRYAFHNVIEGEHTIQLVLEDLPVAYNAPSQVEARVRVQRLEPGKHDFGLILTGTVRGRVELVRASGQHAGLEGAVVTLLPNEFSTYTDEEGVFSFANLPPGSYSVRLEEGSLPEGAAAEETVREKISLSAGQDLELAPFLFNLKIEEKPVKGILEREQIVPAKPKPKPKRSPGSAASNRK